MFYSPEIHEIILILTLYKTVHWGVGIYPLFPLLWSFSKRVKINYKGFNVGPKLMPYTQERWKTIAISPNGVFREDGHTHINIIHLLTILKIRNFCFLENSPRAREEKQALALKAFTELKATTTFILTKIESSNFSTRCSTFLFDKIFISTF